MRVTIIPADGFVSVDSLGFGGIDMASVDQSVHAVQWYGTSGEIERKNAEGKIVANEVLESLDQFAIVLAAHSAAAAAYAAEQAAIAEAESIIEV